MTDTSHTVQCAAKKHLDAALQSAASLTFQEGKARRLLSVSADLLKDT